MASNAATSGSSATAQVADEIQFQDLCGLLEKISKVKGTDSKKQLFSKFLGEWRDAHKRLHPTDADTTTDTFFPIMRLLLPQVDKGRAAYGMKETVLAKYYIDILNIAKDSVDAKKLLNYRAPTAAKQEAGDFAMVAFFVLRNRCPDRGKLTVTQVNEFLDELAMSHVSKDRPGMKRVLQMLLRNTSALEQKWLVRIILKEMKIGLSENSIFNVFHSGASDLFNVCSNMEKVCSDLRDPSVHLNEAAISYFTPFRPMLGERAAIDQIMRLMNNEPFYIETKFDGDRMQLHKQGAQYRYYSRSSKDYTSVFGATEFEGSFSPKIHNNFNSKVKSCILDGEMVGWDPESDTFLPKGDNVDVKGITLNTVGVQQCFVVFDVLMINDTNFANHPLWERAEQLKKVFEPLKGVMHLVDRQDAATLEEALAALNTAIENREEGLLLKKPSSTYQPDKRKGSGWLKIKPEYVDSLSDQLDLIIIGGFFGTGHRSGMISQFMCGVAVPPDNPGDRPSVFHSFCKVGSGYTMSELRDLGIKLKPFWKKFNPKNAPDCVLFSVEKPELWIEPWNSQIVQIKAAEIVVSLKYKCSCTLRFPRVEKVRSDKEWYDCMTTDELEQLKQMASGKLFHQGTSDADELPAPKRRRAATGVEKPRGVAAQFKHTDVSDVQEVSKMFQGKQFCVVNGSPGLSKEEAERKIAEHGGTFVQKPGEETHCVLVHKLIVRAKNIISTGLYDVLKLDWLSQCLIEKRYIPFVPTVMLHTSTSTATKFAELYDKYGDSYTEDVTEDSLRETFKNIQDQHPEDVDITREEIALIEERYFSEDNDRGLFRQQKFYLDMYKEIGDKKSVIPCSSLELTDIELRLHGGLVAEEFDETITHVVFDERDLDRVSKFRELERRHSRKHHFVLSHWVTESIVCKFLKNERPYEP